jgi:hypothetical protein
MEKAPVDPALFLLMGGMVGCSAFTSNTDVIPAKAGIHTLPRTDEAQQMRLRDRPHYTR